MLANFYKNGAEWIWLYPQGTWRNRGDWLNWTVPLYRYRVTEDRYMASFRSTHLLRPD
jgi:hypothetical protein